ncbi:uncharacterized protein K444DRAFT_316621 [Hyaloscypha bicolor E]|uniref:Uncharacterized protein n=1 Tax=Hyaloscypha bicolor E TaxID=1095630 RepID=A0A2J6TLQ5_9HELO|nr:uncharacterized protein K444DRAFT_316621 [Hyaloscypha bicolor E]PMD63937.1 hypothetical protein K444DRAFT_316621 [Hyaloscypha bicolor E]
MDRTSCIRSRNAIYTWGRTLAYRAPYPCMIPLICSLRIRRFCDRLVGMGNSSGVSPFAHLLLSVCLFSCWFGGGSVGKRFETMELEVRWFTLTNLVSFKCSSFDSLRWARS